MLPCSHASMLLSFPALVLACFHALTLSFSHTPVPTCLYALVLSCSHARMLSCSHAHMLSCCHALLISCSRALSLTCSPMLLRLLHVPHVTPCFSFSSCSSMPEMSAPAPRAAACLSMLQFPDALPVPLPWSVLFQHGWAPKPPKHN